MNFAGYKAIVTGGASGIGAAVVQRLLDDGALVSVLDVSIESAALRAFAIEADVSDLSSVTAAVKTAATRMGGNRYRRQQRRNWGQGFG